MEVLPDVRKQKRGDGMSRLISLVIPFCLGAIITRSSRTKDYYVLTFAVIAFVANIAFVYLMGVTE